MGTSQSRPPSPSPSLEGITKLNDSVFELYRPKEGLNTELEVIFFHGLQLGDYEKAYWKTWLSRDGSVVWPMAWLGPSLERARILSISYDSSAQTSAKAGTTRMYNIIENLVTNIAESARARCGQDCKVILVGHSLGGLIIKQLLLQCNDRAGRLDSDQSGDRKRRLETFVRNCKGVFYYATPHSGASLAAYVDQLSIIPGVRPNVKIIDFLKVLSSETSVINNDFGNFRRTKKLRAATATVAESLPTKLGVFSRVVVEEASARYDTDNHYTAKTDHFDVCKPEDQISSSFANLHEFCRQPMEASLDERYEALRKSLPNQ